jgi:hypothetical protein
MALCYGNTVVFYFKIHWYLLKRKMHLINLFLSDDGFDNSTETLLGHGMPIQRRYLISPLTPFRSDVLPQVSLDGVMVNLVAFGCDKKLKVQ